MSVEMWRRIKALEDRVAELEKKPAVEEPKQEAPAVKPESGRKMCPKCGVKPNHFFHVRTCDGQKQDGDKATIDGRDTG
jgi:hypothetical protein